MVRMIVNRLKDPERTERHGGSLPTGVLFYGLPGTGKTATAKAIAKEVKWGFLSKTGGELVRDPRELDKLYRQAKENRPCLIFIDEADELLKCREYASQTEATNKLLTLMDGAGDRVKDVVWMAATNHPEQIDTALLRSGRFTEKLVFELPSLEILTRHLSKWLVQHKVSLAPHLTARTITVMMGEQSIADAQGIVQTALNRAIAKNLDHVIVTRTDVEMAMQTVLGGVHHG
jgi:transitional endoplasmic reticulum ATPase